MRRHIASIASVVMGGALAFAGGCTGDVGAQDLLTSLGNLADRGAAAAGNTAVAAATANHAETASASPSAGVADSLALTDEQLTAARAILDALRSDVEGLRDAARTQVDEALTAAQRTTLAVVGPPIALQFTADAGKEDASAAMMGPGFGRGHDGGERGRGLAGLLRPDVVAAIGLTDEQQSAIETIHSDTRDAVVARFDQAQTDVRALLTAEQLAAIDALSAAHAGWKFGAARGRGGPGGEFGDAGHRGPGGFMHGGFGGRGALLDLTDEQRTQAQELFTQSRTDAQALITAGRDDVQAALSADQLAAIDEISTTGGGWGFVPVRHGAAKLPAGLTDTLAFTEEQTTSILSTVDTLRTALDANRTQAHDDFRAILTADQLATLDTRAIVRLAAGAGPQPAE